MMATFIVTTLNNIDSAVSNYAQTVFASASGPVNAVLIAAGVFGLAWVAANSVLAFAPINMRTYINWLVRYVIILAVATSWSQFQPLYNILTNVPSSYGVILLNQSGVADLNQAMDQMVTTVFDTSDAINADSGWLGISITAVLLMVVGSIMACVAILVSAIAKIGLAMSVSLAPIMIASALFEGTRSLFESWTRFTIGFALIPLILAGVMGAIIGVGTNLMTTAVGATEISQVAGFLIVVLAAIFMMYNVPTLATSLAGSVVAAGTGIAEARSAANNARSGVAGAWGAATSPARAAYGAYARHDAGKQAQLGVSERGGGRAAQIGAYMTQWIRMSKDRQRYSDPSKLRGPSGQPLARNPRTPPSS